MMCTLYIVQCNVIRLNVDCLRMAVFICQMSMRFCIKILINQCLLYHDKLKINNYYTITIINFEIFLYFLLIINTDRFYRYEMIFFSNSYLLLYYLVSILRVSRKKLNGFHTVNFFMFSNIALKKMAAICLKKSIP